MAISLRRMLRMRYPFCITLDDTRTVYLPHRYGAANFVVIDDLRLLPGKVSGVCRRLTR